VVVGMPGVRHGGIVPPFRPRGSVGGPTLPRVVDTVPGGPAGRRVGPFLVEGLLGRGATSTLHRAHDPRVGRRVALKLADDAEVDFREEAEALAAVEHPHVVPLYETGDADGRAWIALRFVEGTNLAAVLGGHPLPPARALGLLEQLAGAVDAVHAAGFVHLDLKPANVLVGPGDDVHLADFGLARRLAAQPVEPGGPDADFVGSPAYAAPEHLRGDAVGPRADLYALTCVVVACMTGRPPHGGGVAAVIEAHHAGDVPPTGFGARVDAVVRRGMASAPADRFASAGELVAALGAALGVAPVPGRAPPARPPASSPPASSPPASSEPVRVRAPVPPDADGWFDRPPPALPPPVLALLAVAAAILLLVVAIVVLTP